MHTLDTALNTLLLAAQAEPMLTLAIAGLWTVVMVAALRRTASGWLLGLVPATLAGLGAGLIALMLPGTAAVVALGFAVVATAFAWPLSTLRLARRGDAAGAPVSSVAAGA